MQAGRPGMLRSAATVEADLLQLEPERAIDRVGPVALAVDDHFSGPVLGNASRGGGEPRFVRPSQLPRVACSATCAVVSEVEPALFKALLSQLAALTEDLREESTPNRNLASLAWLWLSSTWRLT